MSKFLDYFPCCFPKEVWETYIMPHLDVADILKIRYTNSMFNDINWEYMLKNEYPVLYKHLFKEKYIRYTIDKTIIDYGKVFLTIHRNSDMTSKLKIFIKSTNRFKLKILKNLGRNRTISKILTQYVDLNVNSSMFIIDICDEGLFNLFKILLNDARLDMETGDEMLLLFFAFKEYFNCDIMNLIMNHPKFKITTDQLYFILFQLCIDNNMWSIEIISNNRHCKSLITQQINAKTCVKYATNIKDNIKDFDEKIVSYIMKAIENKNKDMVKWMFDNARDINVIYHKIINYLMYNDKNEYLLLLSTYNNIIKHNMTVLSIIHDNTELMMKLLNEQNKSLFLGDIQMYMGYLDIAIHKSNEDIFKYLLNKLENLLNGNYDKIRELFRETLKNNYNLHILKIILNSRSMNPKKTLSFNYMMGNDEYTKTIKCMKLSVFDSIDFKKYEITKIILDKYDLKITDEHFYSLAIYHRDSTVDKSKFKDILKYLLERRNIPFTENTKYKINIMRKHGDCDIISFKFLKDDDFNYDYCRRMMV